MRICRHHEESPDGSGLQPAPSGLDGWHKAHAVWVRNREGYVPRRVGGNRLPPWVAGAAATSIGRWRLAPTGLMLE